MGNKDQGACASQHRSHANVERLGVERGKAFVENDHFALLKKAARQINAAPLAMRKLPTRLTDNRLHSRRHAIDEPTEAELATELLRCCDIVIGPGPATSHQ